MKEIKKHLHGITGALVFLVSTMVVLMFFGFTTPLPLPDEEAVILDFSNSDLIEIESNGGSSGNNSDEDGSKTEKILYQSFEDSQFVPSGDKIIVSDPSNDRIDNLFRNPFQNDGKIGDGDSDNPNRGHGNDDGPDVISGKINSKRKVSKVDPTPKENSFGKVVLEITVNESGNVIDIKLVSSTCNDCVQPAKDAVKKWKYEAIPGSGFQTGTVIIEFKQN
jgi:TonB family protein